MRSFLSFAAMLFAPAVLGAQVHAKGRVTDAQLTMPLAGVVVRSDSGVRAVITDNDGCFSLRVDSLPARLVFARLGFRAETVLVQPGVAIDVRLEHAPLAIDPVLVRGERSYSAASSSVVRQLDVALRPHDSSQRLLALAPGLVIAQHAGGGKAEQIFLRGFDADHGTDVAISVDGVPVNLVSHAHGQGYADLHFLMPELVADVEVRKGSFDARDGNFATAGAVSFRTIDRLPATSVRVRTGSFGSRDAAVAVPFGARDGSTGYAAFSAHRSRGPFLAPQDHHRINAFAKWTGRAGGFRGELTASAFDAEWDASGQVPVRAIRAGEITRFGAVDSTEGGRTSRYDLNASLRSAADAPVTWETGAYLTRYQFRLFSNFTFFLRDSVSGDGIEQMDARWIGGWRGEARAAHRVNGRDAVASFGGSVRHDRVEGGLYDQAHRIRGATRSRNDIAETQLSAWGADEVALTPALRLKLGARVDAFGFDVRDRAGDFDGDRWLAVASPRATLAFDASESTRWFAGFGYGFHSNDARDVARAQSGERTLPRSRSGELGVRHTRAAGTFALTGWLTDLESELVFVGDEGTTEASAATRRLGLDAEARVRLRDWLWADADVNLARGRFRGAPADENLIPLAPTLTSAGGLTARTTPWSGGVRYRVIGSRSADEANTVRARGSSVWEAFASWERSSVRLGLALDNVFNATWNEAQFATTSRLRGESQPVTELHFTPGAPRSLVLSATIHF